QTLRGYGLGAFELRPQDRRGDLARQVRGPYVDPGVLVYLTAEELAAVGSLLPDDLGSISPLLIVDEQRSSLARDDVLGFMEAHRGQVAEASEWPILVGGHDTLGRVVDC